MNVKVHHATDTTERNERWGPPSTPRVMALAELLDETVEEAQTVPYSSHVCRLLDDVEGEDVDDAITEYGARQAGTDYAAVALLRPPVLPRRLVDDESTGPTELFERTPGEVRLERPPAPRPALPSAAGRSDDSVPGLLPLPLPIVEGRTRASVPSLPLLGAMDETEALEDPSAVDESSWGGRVMLSPLDPRLFVPGGAMSKRREHLASLLVEARSVGARLASLLVDTCRLLARIGSVPIPVAWTLAAFVLGVVVSQLVSAL